MANNDYIPAPDAKFDIFQTDFVSTVTDNATNWGITTDELTSLAGAQDPWNKTWDVAKNKDNRTATQIKAKDEARKNYMAFLRPFIQTRIQLNPLLTAADKMLCGIKPRDTVRTRIPAPTATPQLTVVNGPGSGMTLYFNPPKGETGSSTRGKPRGVMGLIVAMQTDGTVPASPEACNVRLVLSRSPKRFSFPPEDVGKKMYYFGCWVNSKGEQGPWTLMQQFIVT